MTASQVLDRVLVLEMVRVTEAAAVAASRLIGRGNEKAADHAAVEAMREALNQLEFDGTVVSKNRDNRSFRLRDAERGTVRIFVTRNTRFERVNGFAGLRVGARNIESVGADRRP